MPKKVWQLIILFLILTGIPFGAKTYVDKVNADTLGDMKAIRENIKSIQKTLDLQYKYLAIINADIKKLLVR